MHNQSDIRTLENIRFIYFDLDDTLLDHKAAQFRALEELKMSYKLFREISTRILQETFHRINAQLWLDYGASKIDRFQLQRMRFELTLKELKLDCSAYAEVARFYMNFYERQWNWIEGARRFYDAVRQVYDVGLLTNGFSELQSKKIERLEFNNTARHIVISEDVGYLKPDPRIFDHATRLTGLAPDEILYIGDSYTSDIAGGSRYGWKTAWFTQNTPDDLQQTPDIIFSDYRQIHRLLIKDHQII